MISPTMTANGRHLRARWMLAGIGWLLWAVSIMLPLYGSGPERVLQFYRDVIGKYVLMSLRGGTLLEAMPQTVVMGFVSATCALAISPALAALNHSHNSSLRRWRWLGMGLLPMTLLDVATAARWPFVLFWPIHLFTLAHIIICIAIIPWPRERAITGAGFEVLIPAQQPPHAQPTEER